MRRENCLNESLPQQLGALVLLPHCLQGQNLVLLEGNLGTATPKASSLLMPDKRSRTHSDFPNSANLSNCWWEAPLSHEQVNRCAIINTVISENHRALTMAVCTCDTTFTKSVLAAWCRTRDCDGLLSWLVGIMIYRLIYLMFYSTVTRHYLEVPTVALLSYSHETSNASWPNTSRKPQPLHIVKRVRHGMNSSQMLPSLVRKEFTEFMTWMSLSTKMNSTYVRVTMT